MIKGTPLFEVGKLIPACEIYIVYKNKEVLMFRRSMSSKNFPGYLLGPGGHIDSNEDPMTAVVRETKEETGFVLEPSQVKLKVLSFHNHIDRKEVWCEYIFRADVESKQELIEDVEGKAEWLSIEDVLNSDIVFPPLKYDIVHILSPNTGLKFTSSKFKNMQMIEESNVQYQKEL